MNAEKLKKSKEYKLVFTNGKKLNGKNFILQFLNTDLSFTRIGITASKKLGNATKRNFVKRRIRCLLKIIYFKKVATSNDLVIVAKKSALTEKFENLSNELNRLLKKIEN